MVNASNSDSCSLKSTGNKQVIRDPYAYVLMTPSIQIGAWACLPGMHTVLSVMLGRTDFYPDRKEEVAGLSIRFALKLLCLVDQAITIPRHAQAPFVAQPWQLRGIPSTWSRTSQ